MITTNSRVRSFAIPVALTAALGMAVLPGVQGSAVAQTRHHSSFFHRHPTATAAGAGIAAYSIAKHTGNNRANYGRHRNFFQRHPVLTGVGAAVIAHHYAKHHR